MGTGAERVGIEPADWLVCGLALAVGGLALISGDAAMMVSLIGTPFALIWIARALLDRKQRSWRLRALIYISALAMLIAGPAGWANQRCQALRFPHELCPLHRMIDPVGSLAPQGLEVCPTIRDVAEQIGSLDDAGSQRHHRNRDAALRVVAHQLQFQLLRLRRLADQALCQLRNMRNEQ